MMKARKGGINVSSHASPYLARPRDSSEVCVKVLRNFEIVRIVIAARDVVHGAAPLRARVPARAVCGASVCEGLGWAEKSGAARLRALGARRAHAHPAEMLSPTSSILRARGVGGAGVPSVVKPTNVKNPFAEAPEKEGSSTWIKRMCRVW